MQLITRHRSSLLTLALVAAVLALPQAAFAQGIPAIERTADLLMSTFVYISVPLAICGLVWAGAKMVFGSGRDEAQLGTVLFGAAIMLGAGLVVNVLR
jgi:type IV secretory pathway VirB2 component (pilin)